MKQQSFEEKLNTLDDILSEFEKQETLTLEKSLSLYEEGIRLVQYRPYSVSAIMSLGSELPLQIYVLLIRDVGA